MGYDQRIIRASEIGEYIFCHRAWWLDRVQGVEPVNRDQMQAGMARHAAHGRAVRRAELLRRAALTFFALALVLAVMFVLATVLSLR